MAFNEFYFIASTESSRVFHRGNKKKKKKIIWILDEYDARGIKFILLKYKVNYNIYYYHTKCH